METKTFWSKQIILYIAVTFIISALGYYIWLPFGLNMPMAGFITILGPCTGALVIYFTSKKQQKVIFKHVSIKDILLGLFLPIIYYAISTLLFCILKGTGLHINTTLNQIIQLTVLWLFSGICEEAGWRGTLLPMLNKIMDWKLSCILCGLIWSAWHLPLILSMQMITSHTIPVAIILFAIEGIALTFIMGIILKFHPKVSIWPFVLIHAIHNVLANTLVTIPNSEAFIDDGGFILVPVIALTALVLWILYSKKNK